MFVCKVCGNEVKSGQAFCSVCGADVVENYETVCPTCNAKNSAGSKYCANCGGMLSSMNKPTCEVCGSKNLPGAKFCITCGAPLRPNSQTHSDDDMIEMRKIKRNLDNMERERMAVVDKEIAQKRVKAAEERELAMKEVDEYRLAQEKEYEKKAQNLEKYRAKLNELGSEDVDLLKKMSSALTDYSKYYADPYSQIDEDDISENVYVCPACGTINPITATTCSHCGRNKARALLLLAKGKIKQSPPIKRKKQVIPAPEESFDKLNVPTLDEFVEELGKEPVVKEEVAEEKAEVQREEQADFSGPRQAQYPQGGYPPYPPYPYPYPPYPYPYPPQMGTAPISQQGQQVPPAYVQQNMQAGIPNAPYQMAPIVQPVAFVPYVSQEQPLVQYNPNAKKPVKAQALPIE